MMTSSVQSIAESFAAQVEHELRSELYRRGIEWITDDVAASADRDLSDIVELSAVRCLGSMMWPGRSDSALMVAQGVRATLDRRVTA